jgi:hypothetical protein
VQRATIRLPAANRGRVTESNNPAAVLEPAGAKYVVRDAKGQSFITAQAREAAYWVKAAAPVCGHFLEPARLSDLPWVR